MRICILIILLILTLVPTTLALAPTNNETPPSGCSPEFTALYENALVAFEGRGEKDITVVTDPLCHHCRLGHKLLNEYPELYKTVRLCFFPRARFIGSDMAAWILEESANQPDLKSKIDFAYTQLQQPMSQDIIEARLIVLSQFIHRFPEMGKGVKLEDLYLELQKKHKAHVLKTTQLASKAKVLGTPTLIAGDSVLMGYGAAPWIKSLKTQAACK